MSGIGRRCMRQQCGFVKLRTMQAQAPRLSACHSHTASSSTSTKEQQQPEVREQEWQRREEQHGRRRREAVFVHEHEYVPLSRLHKYALTVGSLFASLYNPARGDMIALLSELSGEPLLPRLREMMLTTDEGRSLLIDRPALNTQSISMSYLESLGDNTFGKHYWRWLKWCNVGPDTRGKVKFIQDPELAYVMQRYRECHDFYHVMCSMPVSHLGETVVKIFEASHMGLPVAFLSSLAGPLRLSNEERVALFGSSTSLASWAWETGKKSAPLIGVRWEAHWERDFKEMQHSLGFHAPPPMQVTYAGRGKTSRADDVSRGRWPSKMIDKGFGDPAATGTETKG